MSARRGKADIAQVLSIATGNDGIVGDGHQRMPTCNATSVTDTPAERGLLSDRGCSAVTLELGPDASRYAL
jgi:hypothetical protein